MHESIYKQWQKIVTTHSTKFGNKSTINKNITYKLHYFQLFFYLAIQWNRGRSLCDILPEIGIAQGIKNGDNSTWLSHKMTPLTSPSLHNCHHYYMWCHLVLSNNLWLSPVLLTESFFQLVLAPLPGVQFSLPCLFFLFHFKIRFTFTIFILFYSLY